MLLRDKASYNTLIAELGGPDDDHYARTYGIIRHCILNAIPHFHVLEGLVPDIMHMFLEGICRLVLKLLLRYIICTQRYISMEIFNMRLSVFDFGHCDSSNTPTPLSRTNLRKGSFSQSGRYFLKLFSASCCNSSVFAAAQMWCLCRALPFIIGDTIPPNDERWCHFMTLLHIIERVFSPKITHAMSELIPEMVESFLTEYKRLYGENVTPKMHYMCHLHSWMVK